MPADLTREEIAFAREFGPQSPVMKRVIDAAEVHRDQSTSIAALEAENAALRKVFDAACAMDGFGMFDDLESPSGVRMREATRRARALLQEQGEAKG